MKNLSSLTLTLALLFLVIFFPPSPLRGATRTDDWGRTETVSVASTVTLKPDGVLDIRYVIKLRSQSSANCTGLCINKHFLFHQKSLSPTSHAVDVNGNRYNVHLVEDFSPKRIVSLPESVSLNNREITFVLDLTLDGPKSRILKPKRMPYANRHAFFDWRMKWLTEDKRYQKDPPEHEDTLTVVTPYKLPPDTVAGDHAVKQSLIDLQTMSAEELKKTNFTYGRDSENRLCLIFHRTPGYAGNWVSFSMPVSWFNAPAFKPPSPLRPATRSDQIKLAVVLGLIVITAFILYLFKQRAVTATGIFLENIHLEYQDWKKQETISSASYVPGKISKTLSPIEVAFYLGFSLPQILSGILDAMAAQGYLKEIKSNPLTIAVEFRPDLEGFNSYERHFFNSLSDDGVFSNQELKGLMDIVVENIRQKAGDADMAATQQFYLQRLRGYVDLQSTGSREGHQLTERHCWHFWYYHTARHYQREYDWNRDPFRFETALPVEAHRLILEPMDAYIAGHMGVL